MNVWSEDAGHQVLVDAPALGIQLVAASERAIVWTQGVDDPNSESSGVYSAVELWWSPPTTTPADLDPHRAAVLPFQSLSFAVTGGNWAAVRGCVRGATPTAEWGCSVLVVNFSSGGTWRLDRREEGTYLGKPASIDDHVLVIPEVLDGFGVNDSSDSYLLLDVPSLDELERRFRRP